MSCRYMYYDSRRVISSIRLQHDTPIAHHLLYLLQYTCIKRRVKSDVIIVCVSIPLYDKKLCSPNSGYIRNTYYIIHSPK